MDSTRAILRVLSYNMRKLLISYRALLAIVLSLIVVQSASSSVRELCLEYGVRASPLALFPGVTVTSTMSSLLLLCWLMLICDAPFIDETQPYLLLRCGRYIWSAGQLLYMLVMSVLFWLWVAICSVIVLAGCMDSSMEWGSVYHSLSYMPTYEFLSSRTMMANYTVPEAFALSWLLSVLLSIMLSEFTYLINLTTRRMYGALLPVALLLVNWAYYLWDFAWVPLHASPATLASLHWLDPKGLGHLPTLSYSLCFFSFGIALLTALCFLAIRRRMIFIQQPI